MMQAISFTEPLVRSAARRGVLRILGRLFYVAIALLAVYPDYWIFVADRGILMTVPLQGVTPDTKKGWETELHQAGARM